MSATFDILAPLPWGTTTLLEASAGTGKTWTIGALVARYVAEGHATLDQMLVVTFGRAASQELRERVRAQLVEVEAALADPASWTGDSEVVDLLLTGDEATLHERLDRIRDALAGYDAATIATIHQFCSLVLDSLGVAGDTDSRATLVDNLDDLVTEVSDDLYLRAFAHVEPEFSRSEALAIADVAAVRDPQARLEPDAADRSTGPGRKVGFAHKVREELDRRKRLLGLLSYDDLLSQLRDALRDADGSAADRMRRRWRIVLVDEFQDTDPVQWEIFDTAFTGHATMVLIGDPKQAIYGFRGGDVVTYLAAADTAGSRQTLGVNWRSDQALVDRLQAVLRGAALGDPGILVHPVRAHHQGSRLAGLPHPDPLRLRVLRLEDLGRRRGLLTVKQVRPLIAADLAADIRAVVDSGATFDGEPIQPRHIAVIAHRHEDLAAARDALHEVGIPAVVAGGGSVFGTPAATEWLTLLEALEQPHRVARVRAAALTTFLGHGAADLDAGGDQLTDDLAARLRDWAELFAQRGVAAVVEAAHEGGLAARILARVDGDRLLTDLRHIGEVLHETSVRERLGIVALAHWARGQVLEARAQRGSERTRRLDSDAAAVQLVTVHASKGLQYPLVYLPTLADRHVFAQPQLPLFHDDEGRRCRNVAESGEGWAEDARRARAEEAGESLRLLYVAATRAQSQVVTWWAPTKNATASPLHRLLFGREAGQAAVPDQVGVPGDDEVAATLSGWRDLGGPTPEAVRVASPAAVPPRPPATDLVARDFTRAIDETWRRTSYSSLTAIDVAPAPVTVDSEPEDPPRDDEPATLPTGLSTPAPAVTDVPSPMAGLPVGATFGSLVHEVLEHADPEAPDHDGDLRAELRSALDAACVRWPVPGLDLDELADALVQVCDSPLGPLADETTLRRLPVGDRLRELTFELPMAGGDDRSRDGDPVLLGQVADLLRRHLPDDDPVRAYAAQLAHPALGGQRLWGYLTGSIDVALRVGGRYLVVDYKTNWLGAVPAPGEERVLTALDYRPQALAEAMGHSDYPLQALLYSLVLHRFLRWRQPDYDPETHLGGVLYLYLRGMCGPDTPVLDGQPCGVFAWRPPAALVEELSDLFDGRLR